MTRARISVPYHVTIEVEADGEVTGEQLRLLAIELAGYSAAITGTPESMSESGRARWGATMTVDSVAATKDALNAFEERSRALRLPTPVRLIRSEVLADDERERELAAPAFPPLLGAAELAGMLGVSKQRVSALASEGRLPRAVAQLRSGPVWAELHVRRFLDNWDRKPGRPRKADIALTNENDVRIVVELKTDPSRRVVLEADGGVWRVVAMPTLGEGGPTFSSKGEAERWARLALRHGVDESTRPAP